MSPNIEIDPITGAPIIKPIAGPTQANPIMPVVAMPTSSPGLINPTTQSFVAGTTTPKLSFDQMIANAKAAVIKANAVVPTTTVTPVTTVTANATVEDEKHISHLYPGIKQALREGGGDSQQQGQTFEKIKELLEDWSD